MGMVFNIQKFCLQDGPGIRTTVFLKGCPLHCAWCHNPESHFEKSIVLYDREKCVACGRCGETCQNRAHVFEIEHTIDREKCITCGACVEVCGYDALELAGKEMTVDEVILEVLKDRAFYENSGGGLTLSGGEPLLQFDFSYELLRQARLNGINTCVETCGFASTEKIIKIAEVTDFFLYDWKLTDDRLHKEYTGVSNSLILKNLQMIDSLGAKIVLRCPIIPEINDTEQHFEGIARVANSLKNILRVEVEPYHSLGNEKYRKIGLSKDPKGFKLPDSAQIENWINRIQQQTNVEVKKA